MVNISKRMSVFQPKLLDLRHGKGAHVLPSAPAPQLTHVFLRYPRRRGLKPDSRTDGANQFHDRYLPRLKYYNPTLHVDVKNDGNANATMKLVLQFEGTDPEALKAIAKKSTKVRQPPQPKVEEPIQQTQEEQEAEAKLQSPNWRDAPAPQKAPEQKPEEQQQKEEHKPSADDDQVVLKAQPTGELGRSSTPVYTRSVTLAVNSKPHWEIWSWFKKRTGAEAAPMTDADRQLKHKFNKESQQRELDQEKGAIVAVQLKQEREALEKAKKAADEAATRA